MRCGGMGRPHLFLMALSVLPGNNLAISIQRDPSVLCARKMMASSCSLHASCLMLGSIWLHHRRRHCFPLLPGTACAIQDHLFGPRHCTALKSISSSSADQGQLSFLAECDAVDGRQLLPALKGFVPSFASSPSIRVPRLLRPGRDQAQE